MKTGIALRLLICVPASLLGGQCAHTLQGVGTLLLISVHASLLAEPVTAVEDIGKVVDCQGITTVKPVMSQRWTPAEEGLLLMPGDWIRTDVRGANAVQVRMTNQTRLTLGPGTLVELVEPSRAKLIRGEMEADVPKGVTFELLAADDQETTVEGVQVFRSLDGQFRRLEKEPNWLQGFKGTVVTESMGSLLANVEGRNVPLTVGYHKVTVDIRDQIARTSIEESFVNHADGTFEGVFYFPLPQDASISEFGMWIGDELVMADVVEKQRAREIYETILREWRDPGLLEWSGGNIFKARVFPIFAHSEKRIRITYTQVLSLKGSRYRYSYALQSELLKQHPLRELAMDVRIRSAIPLKRVACPTHETRLDHTANSAHVEFSAQDYTPERDFEVEVEIDRGSAPLTLIPHQRGGDGYFLLLLTPPDVGGNWHRDVLPDGDSLELLVLADTSGSMDKAQRRTQDAFLASLLSFLSEKDSFNLATCDVACQWFVDKPVPATEANISTARDFLAARVSLGWTDLDKAFASALERSGPKTHVLYLGDGITTTGDADTVAFAKRLKRLYESKAGTFHAVAMGSSFEPAVLKAIASLGRGSFRRIQGENGPTATAHQLLAELTQPAIRDLKIEFKGFRTARVYPEELPDLPAGSQQIILGRYLPDGRKAKGEVIVTGKRDGKPVQFRSPVDVGQVSQPATVRQVSQPATVRQVSQPVLREKQSDRLVRHKRMSHDLLTYLDKAIETNPTDPAWKRHKFLLFVALDRPEDIEKALRSWIRPRDADSTWRLALGYLLAETNRIPEAIEEFEAIEANDELLPAEYQTLSNWYLVVNNKPKQERAKTQAFVTAPEHLRSRILSYSSLWDEMGTMADKLDPELIAAFTAVFKKSQDTEQFLRLLKHFYENTRDSRLLGCLAEGVIGHTVETAYHLVQAMHPDGQHELDEATADSIAKHIHAARLKAKAPVDLRALDLLEAQVARRAAEVSNQPGPHVQTALSAMRRALNRDWLPGERRLMAELLAGLGRITQEPLAREQLSQLASLRREEKPGTLDRVRISHAMARTLWAYSKSSEAIDEWDAALEEFRNASAGVLPQTAQELFNTFIGLLESRRHYDRGEMKLFMQLKRPADLKQKYWLVQRLYELYNNALANRGEVSLGSGQALYKAVEQKLLEEMETADHIHRSKVVNQLCLIYRTAHQIKLEGATGDLKAFAWERMPKVLERQTNNYQSLVSTVSHTLHDLVGAWEGLAFLIERMEKEPSWFQYSQQDGWDSHSWRVGQCRVEAKELGNLENRLLKLVCAEIRWHLKTQQQQRERNVYHQYGDYFWPEKADAFAKVAEEVLAERKKLGSAVKYIADYLHNGLGRTVRGIEILLEAYRAGILDEGGQSQLVHYLHSQNRHQESIPVLEGLVRRHSDDLSYRCQLMLAYFRAEKPEQLLVLLKETDAYSREGSRWDEDTIAMLGHSCLENQLYEQSAAYYKEVISLHQRTQPRSGIGNGTLSGYYSDLSQACAGLGKTAEAVDAAAGAIVSWGHRLDERQQALDTLTDVLREAPDLDGYVATLNRQVQETGLENPIVRKAIGQVYLDKEDFRKAVEQLRLAAMVQPNDAEIHQALVSVHDQMRDREGAIQQLLDSAELSRRDIKLYRDLGGRYAGLGKPAEAERAYTTIVEMLPNESESHAMIAEIRQDQDRWSEAIVHWQRVANIRSLEPTGYLKLAEAQIHEKQWNAAAETLRTVLAKPWPERFGHVHDDAKEMRKQVERSH